MTDIYELVKEATRQAHKEWLKRLREKGQLEEREDLIKLADDLDVRF